VTETLRFIAVVGGDAKEPVLTQAKQLGGAIVQGAVLLTGGDHIKRPKHPTKVKDAAIQGALAAEPNTDRIISILQEAGGLKDSVVRSALKNGRNALNALASDAMIVLPGEAGTLSEVAFAHMTGRCVIFFGGSESAIKMALAHERLPEIAEQSAALQHALPRPCTVNEIRKAAEDALIHGHRTSNVSEAVEFGVTAPLLATWPKIDAVSLEEWSALVRRFGR